MSQRKLAKRKPLTMLRGPGLMGPGVQQGKKVASPSKRSGIKPVGNFILFKVNNP